MTLRPASVFLHPHKSVKFRHLFYFYLLKGEEKADWVKWSCNWINSLSITVVLLCFCYIVVWFHRKCVNHAGVMKKWHSRITDKESKSNEKKIADLWDKAFFLTFCFRLFFFFNFWLRMRKKVLLSVIEKDKKDASKVNKILSCFLTLCFLTFFLTNYTSYPFWLSKFICEEKQNKSRVSGHTSHYEGHKNRPGWGEDVGKFNQSLHFLCESCQNTPKANILDVDCLLYPYFHPVWQH